MEKYSKIKYQIFKMANDIFEYRSTDVILLESTGIYLENMLDREFLDKNKIIGFNKKFSETPHLKIWERKEGHGYSFLVSFNIPLSHSEYEFYNNEDITLYELEIPKLFTGLDGIKCTNKHLLCKVIRREHISNAFKLLLAIADEEFLCEQLKSYYLNENNSDEKKIYSSFILINTEMIAPQFNLMVMDNLINNKREFDKSYLRFSEEKILSDLVKKIVNHLKHCKNSLTDENKEPSLLLTYQISREVINVGYKQKEYYERAIKNYSMSNLKRFKEKFEQILREKLTILTKLEEKEETTLNIVCNTFTICGQFHASPQMAPYISDIFATIMKYLEILQPKSNLDMITSRVSEVILYCLCNIAQDGKLSGMQGWRPILYEYYKECKYSDEIKLASAVSICLLLGNGESQREYKSEIEEIKIYLNMKKCDLNKSDRTDYLGFTLEEIEGALAMASL